MNKIKKFFNNIRNNHKDLFYSICFLIEFAALFGIFKAFDINFYKYHFYLLFCLISLPFVSFNRSVLINILWCVLLLVGLYYLYVVFITYINGYNYNSLAYYRANQKLFRIFSIELDEKKEYSDIFHYFAPIIFFGIPILIFKKLSKLYNEVILIPYIMQSLFILFLYLIIGALSFSIELSFCHYSEGTIDLAKNACDVALDVAMVQYKLSVLMIICYGIFKKRNKFVLYHLPLLCYPVIRSLLDRYLSAQFVFLVVLIIICYVIFNNIKKVWAPHLTHILYGAGIIAITVLIEKKFFYTNHLIEILGFLCQISLFLYLLSLIFVFPVYLIIQFVKNLPNKK